MKHSPTPDLKISVDGLKELRAALREVDRQFARELGQAGKKAADIVVREATGRVPVLTGRARDSLRATAGRGGSIVGGGTKAPYYPWLEFGGAVGRNKSVQRPKERAGRYLFPALADKRDDVIDEYADLVEQLIGRAGLK